MPCTGTETTTRTNAMLNTLKLHWVIGSSVQTIATFQCNMHIATTLSAQKIVLPRFEVMKLLHPSLSPFSLPHLHHLSNFFASGHTQDLRHSHRRTDTFWLEGWGTGDLIAWKKYTGPANLSLYKRAQISVIIKAFTILTSNETIIIPKTQWNIDFSNLQRKGKLVWKIGYSSTNEGKIKVFDWGEGNDFLFELSGGPKKWGFEKSGFYHNNLLIVAHFNITCYLAADSKR